MNTDLNEKLKQYQRNYYALKKLKNEILICFYSIKMSKQTLKFGNAVVSKKKFMLLNKQLL